MTGSIGIASCEIISYKIPFNPTLGYRLVKQSLAYQRTVSTYCEVLWTCWYQVHISIFWAASTVSLRARPPSTAKMNNLTPARTRTKTPPQHDNKRRCRKECELSWCLRDMSMACPSQRQLVFTLREIILGMLLWLVFFGSRSQSHFPLPLTFLHFDMLCKAS